MRNCVAIEVIHHCLLHISTAVAGAATLRQVCKVRLTGLVQRNEDMIMKRMTQSDINLHFSQICDKKNDRQMNSCNVCSMVFNCVEVTVSKNVFGTVITGRYVRSPLYVK